MSSISPRKGSIRRNKTSPSKGDSLGVQVYVRVRPFSAKEEEEHGLDARSVVAFDKKHVILFDPKDEDRKESFLFDKCFWSMEDQSPTPSPTSMPLGRVRRTSLSSDGSSTRSMRSTLSSYSVGESVKVMDQTAVYSEIGPAILHHTFQGFNTCLMTYGQTGAGKTYTMMGELEDESLWGIMPRLAQDVFARIKSVNSSPGFHCKAEVGYIEIYNETPRDLLSPKSAPASIKVRDDPKTGPYIEGITMVPCADEDKIMQQLRKGNHSRTTGPMEANTTSSRSHAIFIMSITKYKEERHGVYREWCSKTNLVDLAGSERVGQSKSTVGSETKRFQEGTTINKGLFALGRVIDALVEKSQGKQSVVPPYRDSLLTRILQSSFGHNSRTFMIANISPSPISYDETLSTLRYASRAGHIITKASVNLADVRNPTLEALQNDYDELLKKYNDLQDECDRIQTANNQLSLELKEMEASGEEKTMLAESKDMDLMILKEEHDQLMETKVQLEKEQKKQEAALNKAEHKLQEALQGVRQREVLEMQLEQRALELESIGHQLEDSKKQLAECMAKAELVDKQDSEIQDLRQRLVAVEDEASQAAQNHTKLASELQNEISSLMDRLQEMEIEATRVKRQVEMAEHCEAQMLTLAKQREAEISTLKTKLVETEAHITLAKEHEGQQPALSKRVQEAEAEAAILKGQAHDYVQEIASLKTKMEEQAKKHAKQTQHHEREVENLRHKLKEVEINHSDLLEHNESMVGALNKQRSQVQESFNRDSFNEDKEHCDLVEKYEKQIQVLTQQLEKDEAETIAMKKQRDEFEHKLQEVSATLQHVMDSQAKVESPPVAMHQIDDSNLRMELKNSEAERALVKEELRMQQTDNTNLRMELKNLEAQHAVTKEELKLHQTDNSNLRMELENLETQSATTKGELRLHQTDNSNLRMELKNLEIQSAITKEELRLHQLDDSSLRMELKNLEAERALAKEELQLYESEIASLKIQIAKHSEKEPKVQEQLKEITKMKAEAAEAKMKAEEAQLFALDLGTQTSRWKAKVEEATQDSEKWRELKVERDREIQRLEEHLATSKADRRVTQAQFIAEKQRSLDYLHFLTVMEHEISMMSPAKMHSELKSKGLAGAMEPNASPRFTQLLSGTGSPSMAHVLHSPTGTLYSPTHAHTHAHAHAGALSQPTDMDLHTSRFHRQASSPRYPATKAVGSPHSIVDSV